MKLISVYPGIRRTSKSVPSNFDNFFNAFFNTGLPGNSKTNGISQNPAVNVIESDDNFRIELAVPGLSKKDFDIDIDKDVLTIAAKKEVDTKKEDGEYKLREFGFAEFKRVFHLSETIDPNNVKANLNDGILSLILAKKETAKTPPLRKIKVA